MNLLGQLLFVTFFEHVCCKFHIMRTEEDAETGDLISEYLEYK